MQQGPDRWHGRPVISGLLRLVLFAVPIAAATASSGLLVPHLPPSTGLAGFLGRWLPAFAISGLVLLATDRVMRRFLPLVVLLRLTLVFPNEAPSRLKLARQAASTRQLEQVARHARRGDLDAASPGVVAERILTLVAAVEAHDRATRGHSERVRIYADLLAEQMKLPRAHADRLRWAALLHDVGKIMVPRHILRKAGALEDDEWNVVRNHPSEGARLTGALAPWLGEWAGGIVQHHERFDGQGYPAGLDGEHLSRAGRMIAVADAYETMTARRPYRRAFSHAQARAELVRCAGTQFDPVVVRAFLQISLGRLRLVSGPLSWLAQTPLLRGVEQVATAGGAAAVGGAVMIGLAPVSLPPPDPLAPSFSVERVSPIEPIVDPLDALDELLPSTPAPSPSPSPSPSSPPPSPTPTPKPSPSESESPIVKPPPPPPSPDPTTSAEPSTLPFPLPSELDPDELF